MIIFFQIVIAWVYSHFLEYFVHKYVLHNLKVKPAFKHHFRYHHLAARRTGMIDYKYKKPSWFHWLWDDETIGLSFLALLHLPVVFLFPWAYAVLIISALHYFLVHGMSHKDYHWGRKHLSHHYDHHMGTDQGMNWGVRRDWVDRLFRTRGVYKGTKREILNYKRICSAEKRGVRVRSHRNKRIRDREID